MAGGIELRADAQRSLAFGSILAGYALINTLGQPEEFAHIVRMMIVQNLTDALLQFSFDGINDHFVLPAGGQLIVDVTTNRAENTQGYYISIGTRMSVKRIGTPTSGSVYVSAFYARGN